MTSLMNTTCGGRSSSAASDLGGQAHGGAEAPPPGECNTCLRKFSMLNPTPFRRPGHKYLPRSSDPKKPTCLSCMCFIRSQYRLTSTAKVVENFKVGEHQPEYTESIVKWELRFEATDPSSRIANDDRAFDAPMIVSLTQSLKRTGTVVGNNFWAERIFDKRYPEGSEGRTEALEAATKGIASGMFDRLVSG